MAPSTSHPVLTRGKHACQDSGWHVTPAGDKVCSCSQSKLDQKAIVCQSDLCWSEVAAEQYLSEQVLAALVQRQAWSENG